MTTNKSIVSLKQLAHGAGISVIFGIVGYILTFVAKLLAARYFGPEEYGLYSLTTTIFKFLAMLAVLGIPYGINRYIPLYFYQKNLKSLAGYVRFIICFPVALCTLFGVFLFFYSAQIANFFDSPGKLVLFLKIVAVALPFRAASTTLRNIFVSRKKIIYRSISYDLVENLVLLAGISLIIFFNLSLVWFLIAFASSLFFSFVYDFIIYRFKIYLPIKTKPVSHYKEWFSFSIPLLFTGLFAYVISWSDNLVIAKYLSSADLGVYAIAQSLAMALLFFQSSFTGIFMPLISEGYAKKASQTVEFLFKKSASWILGLTFPAFLFMLIFSKSILTFLYGVKYVQGYIVLVIIACGYIINVSTGLNYPILILHKKTKFIFVMNLIFAVINLGLNIFLIPIFGLLGAAITTSVTTASQNIVFLLRARSYESLSFDLKVLSKIIVAALIGIGTSVLLWTFLPHNLLFMVIVLAVYCPLYVILLIVFRTFHSEDYEIINKVCKRLGLDLPKVISKFRRRP